MRLFVFDGNSLICRACFAKGARLTSSQGEPTHGTYFFTQTILRLLRKEKPEAVVFAQDEKRAETFRRKLYPPYKTGRKNHAEGLDVQLRRSFQIANLLGLNVVKVPTMEADDVIASIADIFRGERGVEVVVVGTDKDLDQIVGGNVIRFDPYKEEYIDEDEVFRKYELRPDQLVDYQALIGDSTDAVPGIKGIGPKTAQPLLREYRDWSGIVLAAEQGWIADSASKAILRADKDGTYKLMRSLVELRRDLDFDLDFDDLLFKGPTLEKAKPLFRSLGFRRWD